jgi:hypothetical protein
MRGRDWPQVETTSTLGMLALLGPALLVTASQSRLQKYPPVLLRPFALGHPAVLLLRVIHFKCKLGFHYCI